MYTVNKYSIQMKYHNIIHNTHSQHSVTTFIHNTQSQHFNSMLQQLIVTFIHNTKQITIIATNTNKIFYESHDFFVFLLFNHNLHKFFSKYKKIYTTRF